ncbi:hypothetical protein T12_5356 [Trichinella patagoniensis]|uniref:Uncharacterized protein n=1 Tax=Trichinella patagoniensis TaxID=990121 RepID=A0A0V1AGN5_9BILA|nr:hypothetical protein T12_5356 [Trichinella patagoniensis]
MIRIPAYRLVLPNAKLLSSLLLFAGMRICTIDVKLFDISGAGQRLTGAYVTSLPFTQLGTSTNKYSKNLEQTETKMDKLGRWLLGANSNQMKEHRKKYFLSR